VRLFHFTHEDRLPIIEAKGIAKGDVPTSPDGGFNAPWFTSEDSFFKQAWTATADPRIALDKSEVRLTVEIPDDDPNLQYWPDVAKAEGVEDWWFQALDRTGDGKSDCWYIYRGVVPWEWVMAIDYKSAVQYGAGKTLSFGDR